ncbi:hypothetical protein FRC00_013317 [Tulasnella sp. 408]|nr:hypothetical protein FRC00_013317 [Tulasnella sp. 408]
MYMDAADTSSASESRWDDEDRPPTTPEPPRESTSPPVDFPSETSGVIKRKGSRRPYAPYTRQPKPARSKVLGLLASNTAPPSGQERSLRRPMSLVQQAPSRTSSSTRPATYGRSTSNPFVQDYSSSSSSSKSRPALSNSASFFGLMGNHRRNKSIGADLLADESFGHITSPPALPPLPSTPRTPRLKSPPAASSKIVISNKPSVLPALPPIDIELSPPSPPRLLAEFITVSFSWCDVILGPSERMALLAGNSPKSMRRNSLGDLKIPARISRNPLALKSNLTMVREFAAIFESEW